MDIDLFHLSFFSPPIRVYVSVLSFFFNSFFYFCYRVRMVWSHLPIVQFWLHTYYNYQITHGVYPFIIFPFNFRFVFVMTFFFQ
jgi:hypothetical protein